MPQSVTMKAHKGTCFRQHVAAPVNDAQVTYGGWRLPKEAARRIIIAIVVPHRLLRGSFPLGGSCDCFFRCSLETVRISMASEWQ